MKIRAEQALMLGVVALGLFAGIELFAGGGKGPSPPPTPDPSPNPQPLQPGQFPALPQNQRVIRNGIRYWGRLDYGAGIVPTREEVVNVIGRLGFTDAIIYESLDETTQAIPPIPLVLENSSAGTRWFQATATQTVDLTGAKPQALTYLWIKAG